MGWVIRVPQPSRKSGIPTCSSLVPTYVFGQVNSRTLALCMPPHFCSWRQLTGPVRIMGRVDGLSESGQDDVVQAGNVARYPGRHEQAQLLSPFPRQPIDNPVDGNEVCAVTALLAERASATSCSAGRDVGCCQRGLGESSALRTSGREAEATPHNTPFGLGSEIGSTQFHTVQDASASLA